jgi:protein transport protein DSL1/ZW10
LSAYDQDEFENSGYISIVKELRENFYMFREHLWYELDLLWDKLIQIQILDKKNDKNSLPPICSYVSISNDLSQSLLDQLNIFIDYRRQYMNDSSTFIFYGKMKQFSKKFLEFCLLNIVCVDEDEIVAYDLELCNDDENNRKILKVHNTKKERNEITNDSVYNQQDSLEKKFKQLEVLFEFLHENFLKLSYTSQHAIPSSQRTLMSLFSELVCNDFVKLFYEKLIVNLIPLKDFDKNLETQINKQIDNFERLLKRIQFVQSNKSQFNMFDSFANSIEELYVRKKCRWTIEHARKQIKTESLLFELIKAQELQSNTTSTCSPLKNEKSNEEEKISRLFSELIRSVGKDDSTSANIRRIDLDEFDFFLMASECSISKLCKCIVELMYETSNEALKLMSTSGGEDIKSISLLFLISTNLIDLYASVVPTYYAKHLSELPLLAAVVYNDLSFMTFTCLTITHQYKRSLEKCKLNRGSISDRAIKEILQDYSLIDLVPRLYSLANQILNKQVNNQKLTLIQLLNENNHGLKDLSNVNNYSLLEKDIQKCIHQLEKLSSLWFNVLSFNVYCKLFGELLNMVCNNLISSCLLLEDISSDDSDKLVVLFTKIKTAAYNIFAKTHYKSLAIKFDTTNDLVEEAIIDVNAAKYIDSWQKFNYLIVLLKENLQKIADLWSEGKGPLAINYDSQEVRNLIKALFMNTDKRASILAKIN